MALCIGLMTGTSVDGVDVALVDFRGGGPPELRHGARVPFPDALRDRLQAAIRACGELPALETWSLDDALGTVYAQAVQTVLARSGTAAHDVLAIGCAGQTLYHAPDSHPPLTVQIGNPNIVAERCDITTVADVRRRDVAAGGQGAPLACAFHAAYLREPGVERVVLNIGGIANLTLLPTDPQAPVVGFDTGPGNTLLDLCAFRHLGERMDRDGRWAACGTTDPALLERLMDEPYFGRPAPKSTGRELFNVAWLDARTADLPICPAPVDVQRTLVELTTRTVAEAVLRHAPQTRQVVVAGGGCHNPIIMRSLAARLGTREICTSDALGVDPDWMEATAFAWLAWRAVRGEPANLPSVTGASRSVVLGGIYPAGAARPGPGG